MGKLLEKVKGLLEKFKSQSKKIKVAIVAVIIAVIIAIISMIVYSASDQYEVLFSNLESADSQIVLEQLEKEGIANKVEGDTILVPKEKRDELRLKLASNLSLGSKGYELMDSGSSFGMTDEEFQIKKKRMNEGELEKTIKSFPQVEEARVHITESVESVFAKDKEDGKAAVYLKIKNGSTLTEDQVKSIVALVSGSTKNTPEENVSVIDQNMKLLTDGLNQNGTDGLSSDVVSKQQSLEENYEDKLQKAIVSLLEPVVGKNKVKAIVNVNMDFDSKQKTQTVVDPNKVIISQETSKEINDSVGGTVTESPVDNNMSNEIADKTGDKSSSSREDQKTNYEVGKSETKVISAPGEVKRLTASVMIDGNLDANTQSILEDAVSNAIGLDSTKGDQVTVVGMPFDTTLQQEQEDAVNAFNNEIAAKNRTKWMIIGGVAIAILLAIIVILIVRKRRRDEEEETQMLDALVDDNMMPKDAESFDPISFDVTNEKTHLENEIKKYATEKPEQVVDIIKSWLTENER